MNSDDLEKKETEPKKEEEETKIQLGSDEKLELDKAEDEGN